ncbi:hypothetical protein AHIS2_p086 [Acaryochloris phage A-HIS2]|nr:hypothetical protein AHIS2_p086 [Acaryochloris phage A-HIS2]
MTKLTIVFLVYLTLALGSPDDAQKTKKAEVNFLPQPIYELIHK